MRIVVVDRESEFERSSLVHTYSLCVSGAKRTQEEMRKRKITFIRSDGKFKVEQIFRVWKVGLHGRWEIEFSEI